MKSIIILFSITLCFYGCESPTAPTPRTAADAYTGTYGKAGGRWTDSLQNWGRVLTFTGATGLTLEKNGTYSLCLEAAAIPDHPTLQYSYSQTGRYECVSYTWHEQTQSSAGHWTGHLAFHPAGGYDWSSDFSIWDSATMPLELPARFKMPDNTFLFVDRWIR